MRLGILVAKSARAPLYGCQCTTRKIRLCTTSASDNNSWRDGIFPKNKFRKTLMRSSGPGGQNVNKVNTKVEIRFELTDCDWLEGRVVDRLGRKFAGRVNKDGAFVVVSDRMRTAEQNEQDCYDKLKSMIEIAVKELEEENREPSEDDADILEKKLQRAAKRRRIEKERLKSKRESRSRDDYL